MQHQSGIGALHFLETDTTVYFEKVKGAHWESSALVAILWVSDLGLQAQRLLRLVCKGRYLTAFLFWLAEFNYVFSCRDSPRQFEGLYQVTRSLACTLRSGYCFCVRFHTEYQ